ncbi:MAG TPA: ABC transporter permease [Acidimicrobiales bacterium]|nr:ABC transporter permease [Acidimicrobiales bacterium]
MSWIDNFRVAVRGTTSNKLRSALTMLGVLIGVAAVIILVAVGNGSRAAVAASLGRLGTNTLTVSTSPRGFGRGPSTGGTQSQIAELTLQDVDQISSPDYAPDVQSVSPVIQTEVGAAYSDASDSDIDVYGSTPSYLTADDYTIQAGSPITTSEVSSRARDIDIGQTVLTDLFTSGTNPIGQTIILDDTQSGVTASFQIVGVLASKGSSGITDPNNVIIAPYTALQDQLTGEASTFSQLLVVGKSSSTLNAAESEVESVLATNSDTSEADLPFTILNQAALLSADETTSNTLTVFLIFVATGALIIGGIGLMNIMLVTVTERTREIGIRKAIGAPRGVIISQFLTEAVLLSVLGGAVGVVAGLVGSKFKIDGTVPVVATWSIALAFGVSIVVGVIFGLYPAAKAAGLRPIDALRYE